MIFALLACDPSADVDTDSKKTDTDPGDTADTSDTGDTATVPSKDYTLAIATTSTDYSAGAFATWTADNGLADQLLSLGSDVALQADGDTLYVLSRSTENTVRVYEGGDWSAPTLEFSTGDGSNPHDIVFCGGETVVSLYNEGALGRFDAEGNRIGTVDLSEWADSDGSSEPDSLYVSPSGTLYVSLNIYDYTLYDSLAGGIVAVDCSDWSIRDSWEVGPNTSFAPSPWSTDEVVVLTGNYYDPSDWAMDLDGAVYRFDTATDTLSEALWSEAELGKNIGAMVGDGTHSMLVLNDGYQWNPACFDADGVQTDGPWAESNVFVGATTTTADGRAWVAARAGYSTGVAVEATVALDLADCTEIERVTTTFPPSALAVIR